MRSISLVSVLFILAFVSCKSTTENASEPTKVVVQLTPEEVSINETSNYAVKGMMCEMGCGALIRKKLYETGAVASCSFDFKEDREVNQLMVNYNNSSISALEIEKLISNITESDFEAELLNNKPNENSSF